MATGMNQSDPSLNHQTRAQAKVKISQYFTMLTKGCGQDTCTNTNCASYKTAHKLIDTIPPPNVAARKAVEMMKNKVERCTKENSKTSVNSTETNSTSGGTCLHRSPSSSANPMEVSSRNGDSLPLPQQPDVPDTDENEWEDMEYSTASSDGQEEETHSLPSSLGRRQIGEISRRPPENTMASLPEHGYRPDASVMVGSVFRTLPSRGILRATSSPSSFSPEKDQVKSHDEPVVVNEDDMARLIQEARSAHSPNYSKLKDTVFKVFSSVENLNHSFLMKQGEEKTEPASITVDIESVRRTLLLLEELNDTTLSSTLMNAITYYAKKARLPQYRTSASCLNHIVVMLHNPLLADPDHLETTVPEVFSVISRLTFYQQVQIVQWHSGCEKERLQELVVLVHQSIAFLIAMSDSEDFDIHSSQSISSAVCVLQILYFANLVAAKKAGNVRPGGELVAHLRQQRKKEGLSLYEKMMVHFELHPGDVVDPPLPFDSFLNEELNSRFRVEQDIVARRSHIGTSFFNFPCCLSPVNKVEELQIDNLLTMHQERGNLLIALLTGTLPNRYFDLRVDRNNLIQDTLMQLEIYSEDRPNDLRKQLRIHFRGEEGLDEGGVQKEFFQLLIAELLKPEYAMFTFDSETNNYWLNPYSYESEREFMLIGMLFGVAIYNNIILDIHFPMVIYYKLLGCTTIFKDLYSSHPTVAKSLQHVLDYQGDDFEGVFNLTFCVEQTDMFGHTQQHALKPGGASVAVTMEDRQEYVDLYTDWLLNRSVETQFNSFKKGFHMVIKGTNLINLLRPEELEQLVCGLEEWDFEELEASTLYDSGYDADHQVIRNFWEVVHEFDEDQKKAFLQFVTGTDRVPLGGLSKLKFTIVKNGDDSDRLPTAHTCFNVLLLCPYSTKEKLKERLLKAITHGKGFGML